jgi:5-bromo-4-chloroindolyl phosphate hydrolysis protein
MNSSHQLLIIKYLYKCVVPDIKHRTKAPQFFYSNVILMVETEKVTLIMNIEIDIPKNIVADKK